MIHRQQIRHGTEQVAPRKLMGSVQLLHRAAVTEQGRQHTDSLVCPKALSQVVEMFQAAVDGKASGEPWCMAFVQFCIKMTDGIFDEIFQRTDHGRSRLKLSESVMDVWKNAPEELRQKEPQIGSLIAWQYYQNGEPTWKGHVGVVVDIGEGGAIKTVEGNTSSSDKVEREGDGVFLKTRFWNAKPINSTMICKGFLKPWG